MTGLFGGAFDPPHTGHVALLRDARARLGLDRVVVLVVVDPGHKDVVTDASIRLTLARAAFPGEEVELDLNPRTIDTLLERRYPDPVFLIGADEFTDFPRWKDPDGVLELTRLAVATRPGHPRERLDEVLAGLRRPDRVDFFEVEPVPVSSSEIRALVRAGRPIEGLVPPAVAREIDRLHLYRNETVGRLAEHRPGDETD